MPATARRWRDENVEYDFVRRDWLEENLVFELKSHPPLIVAGEFSRRLVLHPRPRHAARRVQARTAARRNDSGFLRRARRQNDVHRAIDEQPGPHCGTGYFRGTAEIDSGKLRAARRDLRRNLGARLTRLSLRKLKSQVRNLKLVRDRSHRLPRDRRKFSTEFWWTLRARTPA